VTDTAASSLAADLDLALRLADAADRISLGRFRDRDLHVETKPDRSPVTEADLAVERAIREALAVERPADGILGEEYGTEGDTARQWIVDPIDGTANFVRGIPAWCVVIACARDGETVVGVIREPSTDETFYGRLGGGAFVNGRPIRASAGASLSEGSVGTGLSNRASTEHVAVLISSIMAEGGVFYRNASGALMLAYAASGRLLGYVEEHMNAWDCLAGMLLVEEAGGTVLKADPTTVLVQGTQVIAGGKHIFPKLQALCAQAFGR